MATISWQICLDILHDTGGLSDSRMNRSLMKSSLQLISILCSYLAFIYIVGPRLMRDRKPFSLKNLMISYNLVQISTNVFLLIKFWPITQTLNIFCTNHDTSNSEMNLLALEAHHWYILVKYFDLIESCFYVLRKKENQLSFLHVYHHCGILLCAWVSGKYFPGGQALFVGFFNAFVHSVMYCYYLLTSWTPKSSGITSIWWKRYITVLQIVQHCLIFICTFPAVVNPNCSYPKFWMGFFDVQVLFVIYLFVRFYLDTYTTKSKTKSS